MLVPVALLLALAAACGPIKDVVQVSAGEFHTCAVMTDATVQCWGRNTYGQLGDGTTASSKGPVEVVGLTGVASVSAGNDHTCARNTGGAVYCWGRGDSGQLGNGSLTNSSVPVFAQLVSASLDTGRASTCTVSPFDGSVSCWGANALGQLGDGTQTIRTVPTPVIGVTGATSVSVGVNTACVTLSGFNRAKCWGDNPFGAFGIGATPWSFTTVPVPVFESNFYPNLIAVGHTQICASSAASGRPRCAGLNNRGQLGDGTTTDSNTPRLVVHAGTQFNGATSKLTSSWWTTCAVDGLGEHTVCWGKGSEGQLGNGGTADSSVAVDVPAIPDPVSISSGVNHSCAVLSGGSVRCWGDNSGAQLGDGTFTNAATPVSPQAEPRLGSVTDVAGGYFHSCAIVSGTVQCFGYNGLGQLGNGTTTNSADPVPVPGITTASNIATGKQHTCARLTDATVRCWGLNASGQLGNGGTTDSSAPVPVQGIATATAISAGGDHTCALLADTTVSCWGNDAWGQLGNGLPLTNSSSPVGVTGITGATAIAAGENHTCALLSDGTVRCWGRADRGQLGRTLVGPFQFSAAPALAVDGLAGATSVTAGADHNCAAASGNGIKCWGRNDSGQLGNLTTTDSSTAVAVFGSSGDTVVDAGAYHACAIKGSALRCWGANYAGQLGDGTTTSSSAPVDARISGATAIDAGGSHTCAVLPANHADCWGRGDYGQLGNGGTPAALPFPQSVLDAGSRYVAP